MSRGLVWKRQQILASRNLLVPDLLQWRVRKMVFEGHGLPAYAFELRRAIGTLMRVSIVTKTGDSGTTGLMYGRRVPKHHPRVEAYGAVDELNAALGMARASARHDFVRDVVLEIQKNLVAVMGELATAREDQERYAKDGYPRLEPAMTARLEQWVVEIEAQHVSFTGWAMPGGSMNSAALEVARSVSRRAERRISELLADGDLPNPDTLVYFNRLADLLWLMARWVDAQAESAAP